MCVTARRNRIRCRQVWTSRGITKVKTAHAKNAKIAIQVPARTDLCIRLNGGAISVSGIEGHKDIAISVGELRIAVGDPTTYRDVRSSVRIGGQFQAWMHQMAIDASRLGFRRISPEVMHLNLSQIASPSV